MQRHTLLSPSANVSKASRAFLRHCRHERQLAPNTIEAYAQDLANFQGFLSEPTAIEAVSCATIVAYRHHLLGTRRAAPATAKRRLASLRSCFRWFVRQTALRVSPFDGTDTSVRIPKRLPRCLQSNEVALLFARRDLDATSWLAVAMLVATGIRVGELASLRLSQIDVGSGSIRIIGKGDRERVVYVTHPTLLSALMERVTKAGRRDRSLLNSRSGSAMSTASIRRLVAAACRHSGLRRPVTPHMLRHTAATMLMERGTDVRIVQRLLGHRSILTTQLYLHVSDGALRAAVARANVLESTGRIDAP